jgi:excisionase family DNA binding protein
MTKKTTKITRLPAKAKRDLGNTKAGKGEVVYPKPDPLPPLDPNRLLRPEEVAPRLSVSMSTLRRLISAGRLPVVRVGHAIRIRPQDLEGFITSSVEQKPRSTFAKS